MLLQGENVVIAAGGCVLNAVAKVAHTVVHGDGHFFQGAVVAVVIAKQFHLFLPPHTKKY
jgi:hypothetical protein